MGRNFGRSWAKRQKVPKKLNGLGAVAEEKEPDMLEVWVMKLFQTAKDKPSSQKTKNMEIPCFSKTTRPKDEGDGL